MATYTSYYPSGYNTTYFKYTGYYNNDYYAWYGYDPSKSLTGTPVGNSYRANAVGSYKYNVDLGTARTVTRVYLENWHWYGGTTNVGIKDFSVYGTNDAAAFADTTYATLTNLTLVGSFSAAEHVAADTADPQYFDLSSPGSYRYYVFRIINNWGGDSFGWRRIGLQELTSADGDLILGAVELEGCSPFGALALSSIGLSGDGAGYGVLVLPSLDASADGGGTGGLSLSLVELSGNGGGTAALTFSSIGLSGVGTTSVPTDVGGALGYEATSGITLWSHKSASVGGTLGYSLTSEIVIDVISVGGELPYSVSSGIAAHSQNDTIIAGALGYSLTSGIEAHSHIAVSVGGALAYELTSGITADRDLGVTVGGELPYSLASGISAWPSPQADVGGELAYVLTSGIEASGGDSCSGALVYVRYPVR